MKLNVTVLIFLILNNSSCNKDFSNLHIYNSENYYFMAVKVYANSIRRYKSELKIDISKTTNK